jgi:ficolin
MVVYIYACVVDCKALYDIGVRHDGVYNISLPGAGRLPVYCDMVNGGWTVVQRRFAGDVNFTRDYNDYVNGFGSVSADHWLGLQKLHLLTSIPGTTSALRISVEFYNGTSGYQHFGNVYVGDRGSGYRLHVPRTVNDMSTLHIPYNGMADGYGLYHNNGYRFSTVDHDVDGCSCNCASMHGGEGGWWYGHCSYVNINAIYGLQAQGGINMDYITGAYVTNPIMSIKRN